MTIANTIATHYEWIKVISIFVRFSKNTFFGVLQKFSHKFEYAMRWKRLKITGPEHKFLFTSVLHLSISNLLCQEVHRWGPLGHSLSGSIVGMYIYSGILYIYWHYIVFSNVCLTLIWAPNPTASRIPDHSLQVQIILELFILQCVLHTGLFWLCQPK